MEIVWILIPISLVLVGVIAWAFLWAVNSGQFDDLDGPGTAVLMDDDKPPAQPERDRPGALHSPLPHAGEADGEAGG